MPAERKPIISDLDSGEPALYYPPDFRPLVNTSGIQPTITDQDALPPDPHEIDLNHPRYRVAEEFVNRLFPIDN